MNSRDDFNTTWIINEMPEGIGPIESYDMLVYNINELYDSNKNIESLVNNLKKFEGDQILYYWYENDTGKILLGAEFSKKSQAITVNIVGKAPDVKGKPPFASDLYDYVLKDRRNITGNNSIRILSDIQLSDEGFNIWKKLLNKGHKISIYNTEEPGKSFSEIKTEYDLKNYFKHDDNDYKKYQYILSESSALFETIAHFNTRRMRELSGLDLGKLNIMRESK